MFNFLRSRGALWTVHLPLGIQPRHFGNGVRGEATMTDSTVDNVVVPQPPFSPSVGRVFASEAQLAAVNFVAAVTDIMKPGVVHCFHGWNEANVNELTDHTTLDPISGFPAFKSLLCEVKPV